MTLSEPLDRVPWVSCSLARHAGFYFVREHTELGEFLREGAGKKASASRLRFQKSLPVSDGDGEIRSPKFTHHRKVNSYYFSLIVEKWPARAARCSLGIIDNLVRQYITDMPLSGDRPDQVATGEFFHDLFGIASGRGRDGLQRIRTGPGQNCIESGGISK